MTYEFRPANTIEAERSLLLALAGSSGSGKTYSALRIATGLVQGTDKRIKFLDTEGGRGLHYRDMFDYDYAEIKAPFSPQTYQDAVTAAEAQPDAGVIVIDSLSHEWEGEGGILEMADEEILKGGTWPDGNPKIKPPAQWKEPKRAHKKFMARLLQCRAHLIFCLRAEEKMLMENQTDPQSGRKKMVVVAAKDRPIKERWAPICEKRFMYEMTASFLMLESDPGKAVPLKLQEQHRVAFPENAHVSENSGKALADWARGNKSTTGAPSHPSPGASDKGSGDSPRSTAPRLLIQGRELKEFQTIDEWADKMIEVINAIKADNIQGFWDSNKAHMEAIFAKDDYKPHVVRIEGHMENKMERENAE